MTLIYTFAGMALCAAAVLALLPQGAMKRTAALAIGLIVLAACAAALPEQLPIPAIPEAPDTLLTRSGASAESAQAEWLARVAGQEAR